jgi:hypothetical protein
MIVSHEHDGRTTVPEEGGGDDVRRRAVPSLKGEAGQLDPENQRDLERQREGP